MKFSYSAIISVIIASSVMAAPTAVVDVANLTPSAIPETTATRDPMSGATAIASITVGNNQDDTTVKAQSLSASGSERTVIGAASVALPIAVLSAIAFM